MKNRTVNVQLSAQQRSVMEALDKARIPVETVELRRVRVVSQNREPIGDPVWHTLRRLEQRGLVAADRNITPVAWTNTDLGRVVLSGALG